MGHSARRAFTLIELLLVLVILAVLASVVVPLYIHRVDEAREKATLADIQQLKSVLATFQIDNGRFPSTDEGLDALVLAPPDLVATWNGPYIEQVTPDKWGNYYRYEFPSRDDPTTYSLFSCGRDQQEGTSDDLTRYTIVSPTGRPTP
jgi:general secretion pathway protein G